MIKMLTQEMAETQLVELSKHLTGYDFMRIHKSIVHVLNDTIYIIVTQQKINVLNTVQALKLIKN